MESHGTFFAVFLLFGSAVLRAPKRHRNGSGWCRQLELLIDHGPEVPRSDGQAHISASALATATVTTPLTINLTNRGRKSVMERRGTQGWRHSLPAISPTIRRLRLIWTWSIITTSGADANSPLGKSPANLYYFPLSLTGRSRPF